MAEVVINFDELDDETYAELLTEAAVIKSHSDDSLGH